MSQTELSVDDLIDELLPLLAQDKFNFSKCATADRGNGPLVLYKRDVVAALLKTTGVMIEAATLLNVRRCKLVSYVHSNIDILDLKEDLRQGQVDLVEKAQLKAAMEDDAAAGRFILQTIGKDRGYSKTLELKGGGFGPKPQVTDSQTLVEKARAFKDRILQTHGN